MWTPLWVSRDKVDYSISTGLSLDCTFTYAHRVDDTKSQGSPLQAVPHGQDGIGSLSRLRDKDGNIIPKDGCPSVKEIGSELDSNGNVGQFLKDGSNSDTRVVRSTTSDE